VDQLTTLKYISCMFSCHALALIITRQAKKGNQSRRKRERERLQLKKLLCVYIYFLWALKAWRWWVFGVVGVSRARSFTDLVSHTNNTCTNPCTHYYYYYYYSLQLLVAFPIVSIFWRICSWHVLFFFFFFFFCRNCCCYIWNTPNAILHLKSISLRQKEETLIWRLKYFTMQKYSLQKIL